MTGATERVVHVPAKRPDRRRLRARVLALIGCCHPEPTVAVVAVSAALAAAAGRGLGGTVAVGTAIAAGQLSVGWSNDALDADRDVRAGRSDKPIAAGAVSRRTVWWAAAVAATAVVPLSLLSGWRAGLVHIASVALAWSYNLRLKATPLSFVPYALAFGGIPAFITYGLPGHPTPAAWAIAGGALLGAGAHFANVLPDLDDDLTENIRGLPQRLGPGRSRIIAGVALAGAGALLALGPGHPSWVSIAGVVVSAILVVGGLALGRRRADRMAFRSVLLAALLDVALLLGHASRLR